MPYPALPDRRMPYDSDGTVIAVGDLYAGVVSYPLSAAVQHMNGTAYTGATGCPSWGMSPSATATLWAFFPEEREVSAIYCMGFGTGSGWPTPYYWGYTGYGDWTAIRGSTDTTNGLDGSWELGVVSPSGAPNGWTDAFSWRSKIKAVSFTGPKKVIRVEFQSNTTAYCGQLHLYGTKGGGETPDDILFLDGLNSYAEFTAPEDFGDRPLGTTASRTFKVKNSSATLTANTISIQCNDSDFTISTDNVTWVTNISISSLAAGASSSIMYVRDTSPSPGAALNPRFARIVATVGSWT